MNMGRVHFAFGDSGPDLLLDNLARGFFLAGYDVSWWPDKPHVNARIPTLSPPSIQCWGTHGWGWPCPSLSCARWCKPDDLAIVTHGAPAHVIEQVAALPCRRVAIDAYDQPMFAWRDAVEAKGLTVLAREQPRAGELPIDYPFNPIWVPSGQSQADARPVSLMLAGDMGVGNRVKIKETLTGRFPQAVIAPGAQGRIPFQDWPTALALSRVCVVPHGAGETTYRLWEAAAAGCALLVERFRTRPAPEGLIEGDTCMFFDASAEPDTPEHVLAKAQTMVYGNGVATRLAITARNEALARHAPEHVAKYVAARVAASVMSTPPQAVPAAPA